MQNMLNLCRPNSATDLQAIPVRRKKPRLALLCGGLLFRGYVEIIKGLEDAFDVTAFTWAETELPVTGLRLPIKRVCSLESILPSKYALTRFLSRQIAKRVGNGFVPFFEQQLKDFDILYTQEAYTGWTRQAVECKLRYGNRVVVQVIENLPFRRETERCTAEAKLAAYKHADLFIAQTQQAHDVCVLEGADRDKIEVVPLAVDTDLFRPALKDADLLAELECTHDDLIVLYTGRLLWAKGILDFVEAAALVDKDPSCSHVKFVVVGDGPDKELMLKYIDTYKVQSRFRFMSRVDYSRMPKIYNIADIVVVPSSISAIWEEQFGMVLAESMACSKPIIATNTGAIHEVVGDCSILVPCHASKQLAEAIQLLVHAPEQRALMGQKGHSMVQHKYSVSVASAKLKRHLLSVISKQQGA